MHCRAGVKVLDRSQYDSPEAGVQAATDELKSTLEGLAAHLFGSGIEVRDTSSISGSTQPLHFGSASQLAYLAGACRAYGVPALAQYQPWREQVSMEGDVFKVAASREEGSSRWCCMPAHHKGSR